MLKDACMHFIFPLLSDCVSLSTEMDGDRFASYSEKLRFLKHWVKAYLQAPC